MVQQPAWVSPSAGPALAAVAGPHRPAAATAQPVRIVIADEHPIFRDGLRWLLETAPGLRVVGETGSGEEAAALVGRLQPDILLLGLATSGPIPLESLEGITAAGASVRTILLTGSVNTFEVMTAALQLGASGVVPKDSAAEVLFKSIDAVMAGQYWFGRECVSDVASSMRRLEHARRRTRAFGLTRRELAIVRSVVSGETNKQIAQQLSISENTVKRHITHIFNKVGASNRVELAVFAAHHQLVDRF